MATYYTAFGLTMAGISSRAAGTIQNKEKTFQGQRFDDELGLNWIQFKWRNHDVQIGRFIEIDPLSEKYEYNSTYAFSENKVTNHVELEGLEAVSAGNPMGYLVEGFRQMGQAAGRIIDKINPFHGGEVHDNLEAKVTATGGLASGGSVETSTTVTLAEKSTSFKVGSFEELFKSGKGPIEYNSVNSTMTKVEQKNAFNTIIRGVPTEFSQKTTVDKNSTTISVGAKVGTGNLLDKSKVEAGADLFYKNQTSGVGIGKSLGIKISADATFVVKQANVLNTPLVQVKATVQNKVGGSFFLDWKF
jgi:RHS repeat-associated protein